MLDKSLVYSPAFYRENTMFEEPGTESICPQDEKHRREKKLYEQASKERK